jgi:hypothetical protein
MACKKISIIAKTVSMVLKFGSAAWRKPVNRTKRTIAISDDKMSDSLIREINQSNRALSGSLRKSGFTFIA